MLFGKTIKQINQHEPTNGDDPLCWWVGKEGVTAIKHRQENFGTYGVDFFDVYRGDNVIASITLMSVATILYEEEKE